MTSQERAFHDFAQFAAQLKGDEKSYLIEMQSRGAKLSAHYKQTFDYWLNLVPHRPPFVALCDFDQLWINTQFNEPVDCLKIGELFQRHFALNFLFPRQFILIFGNNWVEVTHQVARDVADAFNSIVDRGEDRALPSAVTEFISKDCVAVEAL